MKMVLLNIFVFVRYYIDLTIDKLFSLYYDPKIVPLKDVSDPIILESATKLAKKIRKHELTSEQVVKAFIEQIKAVNPIINAVVDTCFEEAIKEAQKIDQEILNGTIQDLDFQDKPFLGNN